MTVLKKLKILSLVLLTTIFSFSIVVVGYIISIILSALTITAIIWLLGAIYVHEQKLYKEIIK